MVPLVPNGAGTQINITEMEKNYNYTLTLA